MLLLLGGESEAVTALTIDGVAVAIQRGWEIHATTNGRAVMRFDVVSIPEASAGGSFMSLLLYTFGEEAGEAYRPELDKEVVFTVDDEELFAGVIEGLSEKGVGDIGWDKIVTTVLARDFNTLATRRYVSETIPAGTLKEALEVIVNYIPGGVTLDPAQADGPAMAEMVFEDVKVEEVLNYLCALTDFIWEIDNDKLLRMFQPGTITAPFNIAPGDSKIMGDLAIEPTRQEYANRVIVRNGLYRKQADDASEQTDHGLWELLLEAPEDASEADVQTAADAYLARRTIVLKKARYATREKGVFPGQTMVIEKPERDVNNTFLITDVTMRALGDRIGVRRDVSAIEGLAIHSGWRDTYKRWNGTTEPIAGAGGFGGTGAQRPAYPLGGNGVEGVSSPTPDWVPVQGGVPGVPLAIGQGSAHVQINTATRLTTAATVHVRLRAMNAGVSVKARLYDLTDGVSVGEGSLITSTSWQPSVFGVTLPPGAHLYELQLLPGASDEIVFGSGGYVE